jgi:hypothetical protein
MAALKGAIAHFADDEGWATVRPPLVRLAPEQRRALVEELPATFAMSGLAE